MWLLIRAFAPVIMMALPAVALFVYYEGVPLFYKGKIDRVCAERLAAAQAIEQQRQARIAETYSKQYDEIAARLEAEKEARSRLQEEMDNEANTDSRAGECGVSAPGVQRINRSGR